MKKKKWKNNIAMLFFHLKYIWNMYSRVKGSHPTWLLPPQQAVTGKVQGVLSCCEQREVSFRWLVKKVRKRKKSGKKTEKGKMKNSLLTETDAFGSADQPWKMEK